MNARRCPDCGGLVVLFEDGFQCYCCGRSIYDPQKRLPAWVGSDAGKDGEAQAQSDQGLSPKRHGGEEDERK